MRRAEANLRLDDMETGDPEEAGNDLHSQENVISYPGVSTRNIAFQIHAVTLCASSLAWPATAANSKFMDGGCVGDSLDELNGHPSILFPLKASHNAIGSAFVWSPTELN